MITSLAHRRRAFVIVLGSVWLGACAANFCTTVDCESGLLLAFDREPPPGTVITLLLPQAPPWVVDCDTYTECNSKLFFAGVQSSTATVRITSEAGDTVHEIRPEYMTQSPNGVRCGPTCHFAEVQVTIS